MASISIPVEQSGWAGLMKVCRPLMRHGLLLPCLLFMAFIFVWPILSLLAKGVYSPEVRDTLPQTAAAVLAWDGAGDPPDAVYAALVADLRVADRRVVANAGRRLNYEIPSYRSLLIKTASALQNSSTEPPRQQLTTIDAKWQDRTFWTAMRRAAPAVTPYYILKALDLEQKDGGGIGKVKPEEATFVDVLGRSLSISAVVTGICLVLAFPVAFRISAASPRWRGLLLLLVLLPFWTSLLVRTSAWVVLLQDNGIVNSLLLWSGIVDQPVHLIFNRIGVYIAFVHVMLPFMILPIYSVMVGISKDYTRAAYSLGASGPRTFYKVYLPLVWPGLWSGCLLTYVIVVGYYITPLLVGGSQDQMLSYFIAFYTKQTVNWGLASALAILLTTCVLVLVGLYGLLGRKSQIVVKA
ncbi:MULTISPECIES: ABC transporter permease [unclassified Mesorhizobium]|uniref:ABC transporter permease n=2 Tax=Mesorhizobium TaxID=68287 RepID=UPI000FDBD7B4|nr:MULTISPECIES: ABC transporter permease [unclassified Mesorhizobium]TGQ04908.1 ABC transporter permease [Mesorhizobium sp. M2E.F.Ca.ET.219.01.1.1]TGT65650.1 ABC transporter permease [Mesorhizobium sp. M2E.F.Ca.ET.166.01.1.1]TGV97695.1 ABC transporter permease [Mesorhizobium sp. M2E.F.Ca.ET.154.01.1.1]